MTAPLTSDQIARLLGGVMAKPVACKRKRRTTVTLSMAAEIRKTYAKNSTYTWAELGKRFGLSKSAARSVIIQ